MSIQVNFRVDPRPETGQTDAACLMSASRFSIQSFSLLEALTAVALAAVLSTLFLGVYQRGMDEGRRMECLNNLRQLGIAFHLHAVDHDGRLPFPNNSAFGEDGAHRELCWYCALDNNLSAAGPIATSLEEERILLIKQDPAFKAFVPAWRTNSHTIKMNENLGRFDPRGVETRSHFWSVEEIGEPGRTVLLFDGRAEGETLSDGSPSIIASRSDGTEGYVARRHRDGANVLFVDGHLEHRREKPQSTGTQRGWEVGETRLIWKPWDSE